MTPITPERVEELREYVRTGRLLVTGDPADVSALINAIDDYAKVKAENERLREENGVFDSELGRLRMENEKWCAREEKK